MGSRATAALVMAGLGAGVAVGVAASRQSPSAEPAALVAVGPMTACGRAVVQDWDDNQRVDRLYPLHCYRDALAALTVNTEYTNAPKAIHRALSYARDRQADPTAVTVATIRAGSTVVLRASLARPGDWIACVKQGNRMRARVQPRGRGVGLSADGATYSATLDVTTSESGRVVARCR
jgi:hypothetical protein